MAFEIIKLTYLLIQIPHDIRKLHHYHLQNCCYWLMWPWSNDLHIRTWPVFHRDTPDVQIRTSYTIDWVRLNVPPTQYRSYGDGFLWIKWPNQQCQSTEGTLPTRRLSKVIMRHTYIHIYRQTRPVHSNKGTKTRHSIMKHVLCCSRPVPRSRADTWTIPLASMSNETSTWGTPRGAGGIPTCHHSHTNTTRVSFFKSQLPDFHVVVSLLTDVPSSYPKYPICKYWGIFWQLMAIWFKLAL